MNQSVVSKIYSILIYINGVDKIFKNTSKMTIKLEQFLFTTLTTEQFICKCCV